MEEKEINKILKPGKVLLIVTIAFVLLTVGIFVAGFYENYSAKKNPKELGTLIRNDEEEEGQYVKLKMSYVPYVFAEEGTTNPYYYYFAWDAEDYMYIVRLTDETYKQIADLKKEDSDTIEYELKGYTFKTPASLKKIAIEELNEIYENNEVTSSNFTEYFGKVYIDETEIPTNTSGDATLYGIGFCVGIFALMFVIIYVSRMKGTINFRKNPEKYEELKEELASLTDNQYSKLKVYLTSKYIIAKSSAVIAIPYKDVIWEYTTIHYRNGVAMNKSLTICTSNKKKIVIATSGPNDTDIDEMMVEIQDRNENVKIGYTKENRQYYRDYRKENIQ